MKRFVPYVRERTERTGQRRNNRYTFETLGVSRP
jgi:hypothetical protein